MSRVGGLGLALLFIGGVQIGGGGGELGGAGVHALVHRAYVQSVAVGAKRIFADIQQSGQARVGKPLALQAAHGVGVESAQGRAAYARLHVHQLLDLHQEPRIDVGQIMNLVNVHAAAQGVGQVPQPLRAGGLQLVAQALPGIAGGDIHDLIKT